MIPRLSTLTTLRVGGVPQRLVDAATEAELIAAVRAADEADEPVLLLGGGSNIVVADSGFAGTVVRVGTRGVRLEEDGCGGAWITVAAGESWDALVERAVEEEWSGLEALSGIPGLVGATPIQNVGAYGSEIGDSIARVRLWDRRRARVEVWPVGDLGLGYRTSRLKVEPERYVVLEVSFQLRRGSLSAPIRYGELARRLDVAEGARVPMTQVREAVLELRRGKGMIATAPGLDRRPVDHDTWSVGSFFINPVLPRGVADRLPPEAPRFEQGADEVKTSAAWLVEAAGFPRGWRPVPDFPAALSSRHTLAITNRGTATAADVLEVAARVRAGVSHMFGIVLEPEPRLVGCALPDLG